MDVVEYRDLLDRNKLRRADVAWICGVGERHARSWGLGRYLIPQYAALILRAYDQGLITPSWLLDQVADPPPA
jgi:hypothetical protein